ncbi:MAG: PaaI family thioesterase, partial [Acidobacteriota bacterium]
GPSGDAHAPFTYRSREPPAAGHRGPGRSAMTPPPSGAERKASARERRLEVSWDPSGQVMAAAREGRYGGGRELLQGIVDGELPQPPIASLFGYELTEVGDGRAVFECVPGEQHYNPMDVVHGGVAATLLDSAMGCAVHTGLPIAVGYTTLELKVNYLRPMTQRTGRVRAIGTVLHSGRSTALAEGRLEDGRGRLVAHATTTCILFRS